MKRIYSFFAAVILVIVLSIILLPGSAKAEILTEYYAPEFWGDSGVNWVTWPQTCSGDAVEFTIRVGNQEIGGDHELNHMVGNVYQEAGGQFAWGNGVDVDFTMTHDSATGDVTLSFAGGPSTTWHSGRPGEAVQNFFLLAKTGSSNPDYKSEVKNLSLNGEPISATLVSENKDKPSMRIYGESFSNFVLQGTINFFWGSNPPNNGSMIVARISVTFAGDDIDGDGFGNACDNCPTAINSDLADADNDTIGDVCDVCPIDPTNDLDSDGICGLSDNCPAVSNTGQEDCNGNSIGDVCDAVNPGATEICDNIDNNCNGSTDENLTQATSCGLGECGATGIETCSAGVWGGDTCVAGIPSAEICDNLDNNCDGSIDENLTQATSCGVGECGASGIETCTAGVWGGDSCVAGTPSAETCDNLDNNCDGSVDENLTQASSCGVGACAGNTGEEICTAGVWGGDTCNPLAGATAETCDNLDNNCDGSIDESLTQVISCELPGACVNDTGVLSCIGGLWDNTCDSLPSATAEVCDTLDNDCDGITDEGVTEIFYFDLDQDNYGTVEITENACSQPVDFVSISGDCNDNNDTVYPGAAETCGDGIDQDCDGADDQCISLVQLEGSQEYHDLIQNAYDAIIGLGVSIETIKAQSIEYTESLIFDQDITVNLIGGHDEFFSGPPTGFTTIVSLAGPTIIISNGLVIIDNVILM